MLSYKTPNSTERCTTVTNTTPTDEGLDTSYSPVAGRLVAQQTGIVAHRCLS